jgi:hypothetical protein
MVVFCFQVEKVYHIQTPVEPVYRYRILEESKVAESECDFVTDRWYLPLQGMPMFGIKASSCSCTFDAIATWSFAYNITKLINRALSLVYFLHLNVQKLYMI